MADSSSTPSISPQSSSSAEAKSATSSQPAMLVESKCIKADEETYPVELFLSNPILEHFKCEFCGDILADPVQFMCEDVVHTCCDYCLDKECPVCKKIEHDGSSVSFSEENHPFTDKLNRIILELEVKCKFQPAGCPWTGKLKELFGFYGEKDHLSVCQFNIVKCHNEGCKEIMHGRCLEEHDKLCLYFQVNCNCGKSMLRKDMADHIKVECPLAPSECKLCGAIMKRNLLETHLREEVSGIPPCPEAMVDCKFKKYGCNEQIKRKDIQFHNTQAAEKHMNLRIKTADKIKLGQNVVRKYGSFNTVEEEKIMIFNVPYLICRVNSVVMMTNLGTSSMFLRFEYWFHDGTFKTIAEKFEPNVERKILFHRSDYGSYLDNIEQLVP